MHLTSQSEGRFVDIVGQILVDGVVTKWLVNEELVLHAALHVLHFGLQAINLFVLRLASFHELN